jgi:hypothetical protein
MKKMDDRLSRIIQVYLQGDLELETAVAELTHVYLERGWRFTLIESECEPRYRDRMRILAARVASARPTVRHSRAVETGGSSSLRR